MSTAPSRPPTPPRPTRLQLVEESRTGPGASTASGGAFRLRPGSVLPQTRYRIDHWLGEGNMGVIYRATHVELGRSVAVKVLASTWRTDARAIEAMRDEARAAARIGSPHIVDVYDLVSLPDGRVAFLMQLLDGRSLAECMAMDDTSFTEGDAVAILRQVCKGLDAAHRAGIVHRDIKPANVMLMESGGPMRVKIVDFGIASGFGGGAGMDGAGTPRFMSPEQILGRACDGRSDMYSVGIMAYELLTGRLPFEADEVSEILRQQLDDAPPSFASLECDRGPAIETVVMRCLAKDPEERFADMADLEAALLEAQLDAGRSAPREDLSVPEGIEPDRRDALLARLPEPELRLDRRRWLVPALVGALLTMTFVAGAVAWHSAADSVQSGDEIEGLVDRARAAGARARWVYPYPDEPDEETAYQVVQELADAGGDAQTASLGLRDEFARTLVRLGDDYWEHPGGRPFALDFYLQALLFDDTMEPANTRVGLSPAHLAELRRKARTGGFSTPELLAVEPLAVLAEPDPEVRDEKLSELRLRRRDAYSASTHESLRQVSSPPKSAKPPRSDSEGAAKPAQRDTQPNAVASPPTDTAPPPSKVQAPQTNPSRNVELEAAQAFVRSGHKARAQGSLEAAERHYQDALRAQPANVDALVGLGRVQFDRGRYTEAVRLRKLAVKKRPHDARLHLELGDAYFKVLRLDDARASYERAVALGLTSARRRIEKVDQKR